MNAVRTIVWVLVLLVPPAAVSAISQSDTREAGSGGSDRPIISELVERLEVVNYVDWGADGPSPGDLIVWGPNPLFDAENAIDAGATTQGSCTTFNAGFDCLLTETIDFGSGGTLEIRGIRPGAPIPSTWTIVGGSGSFLGATGTVTVSSTVDPAIWARRFEIWL